MYVRQVRRKCSVRGCRCTDSFAVSLTREAGNTVIICKNCLEKALKAIGEIDPKTKSNIPKASGKEAPPLFFNEQIKNTEKTTPPVSKPEEGTDKRKKKKGAETE